jgi:hypothetical protein
MYAKPIAEKPLFGSSAIDGAAEETHRKTDNVFDDEEESPLMPHRKSNSNTANDSRQSNKVLPPPTQKPLDAIFSDESEDEDYGAAKKKPIAPKNLGFLDDDDNDDVFVPVKR